MRRGILVAAIVAAVLLGGAQAASATTFGANGTCMGWIEAHVQPGAKNGRVFPQARIVCNAGVAQPRYCFAYSFNGVQKDSMCVWPPLENGNWDGGEWIPMTKRYRPGRHEFCVLVVSAWGQWLTGGCTWVYISDPRSIIPKIV